MRSHTRNHFSGKWRGALLVGWEKQLDEFLGLEEFGGLYDPSFAELHRRVLLVLDDRFLTTAVPH